MNAAFEFYKTRLVFTSPKHPGVRIWFKHTHVWTLPRMVAVARLAKESFRDMERK